MTPDPNRPEAGKLPPSTDSTEAAIAYVLAGHFPCIKHDAIHAASSAVRVALEFIGVELRHLDASGASHGE